VRVSAGRFGSAWLPLCGRDDVAVNAEVDVDYAMSGDARLAFRVRAGGPHPIVWVAKWLAMQDERDDSRAGCLLQGQYEQPVGLVRLVLEQAADSLGVEHRRTVWACRAEALQRHAGIMSHRLKPVATQQCTQVRSCHSAARRYSSGTMSASRRISSLCSNSRKRR
jgi:hypothetical protein